MKNYYFTFGQSHQTLEGIPMKDYWVRVVASNYDEARTKFVTQFTSVYMEKPEKFAFQYNELQFKPEYHPLGEFDCIY